ncbi:hypothetical protein J4772_24750 [Cohnella sp. LGH]|uniref:hypothetical protein n=1 Tax=Cohnella sp. LGH TaxID=1619153 RepID=UPI001ADB437C|nr:hypothetical protein [Cohnella sp. LGH]QTH40757.1 hypothetical protein J4772_24750 [Cohnella sp. LGH]
MGLPTGIVCFIDILGFKQMVLNDSGTKAPVFLPIIETMLSSLRPMLLEEGLQLRQFSDSIVLSIDYSVENSIKIIDAASNVQWFMVSNGVLVRGGIAIGRHYSNGDIVFSQGLIEAYTLESQNARVPRIIIDNNLIDLILATAISKEKLIEKLQILLAVDSDTRSFVNYLEGREYKQHENVILKLLSKADVTKPGLFEKYNWLSDYHNFVMKLVGEAEMDFGLPRISKWDI